MENSFFEISSGLLSNNAKWYSVSQKVLYARIDD